MKEKRTELLVGLFLLIGLVVLGGLVLRFGSFDERFRDTYPLTVTFEDGGGLVDGTDVRLGGVKIGRVAEPPRVNVEDYGGAIVELEIFGDFQVPEGSKFAIGNSGLLGDSLIEITAPRKRSGEYIEPGTTIEGARSAGLGALASSAENLSKKGQAVLEDVRDALKNLGSAVEKLDQKILREENLQQFDTAMSELSTALEAINSRVLNDGNSTSLAELLANLKEASAKLDAASEKVGPLLDSGEEAIAALEPGLRRLSAAAAGADEAIDKINEGPGVLQTLLADPQLKEDVRSFVANLRRSGILRYKDTAAPVDGRTDPAGTRRKGFFGGR